MVSVTKATIASNVWQNVYDILKNITDPKSRGISTDWIHSSFPDTKNWEKKYPNIDFFPQISIESPDMNRPQFVMGGSRHLHSIGIIITIQDTRKGRVDSLFDTIISTLDSNRSALTTLGIRQPEITGTPTSVVFVNQLRVHEKMINLQFQVAK